MTEQRPRWLLPVAAVAAFAFTAGLPAALYIPAVANSAVAWIVALANLVVPPIVAVTFRSSSRERLRQASQGVLLGWGVGLVVGFVVCFNAVMSNIQFG
jgi:flagellar biosynthesis protein FliR